MRPKLAVLLVVCGLAFDAATRSLAAAEFDEFLQPLFVTKCANCHGEKEPKGQINFLALTSGDKLLAQPALVQRVLEAVDANDMPPEDAPQLSMQERSRLLSTLKKMLQQSVAASARQRSPLHRLNRFQYNNAVRDLFQLNRDIFELPEKLLTRQDRYVPAPHGRMPDRVQVVSQALSPPPGLAGVQAFPKDLRAEHGFDNQANQLTLSPLLLDSFLRLSVSIVESPDFNAKTVGIWNEFFQPPAVVTDNANGANDENIRAEVERRLKKFLRLAFRGVVDPPTLQRYVDYAVNKQRQGLSFTESMQKVASAVLCSPMFLYRSPDADASPGASATSQFELASKLSFFLWASIPDEPLLQLAERGELSQRDVLQKTIDRMLNDRRIERFLDTFPAQWLQLENLLAVTPDPKKSRYFRLDENYPASLQMVIEPLLLFDAVFIENRPIAEFIAPQFGYRSDFLQDWYSSDLRAPEVDAQQLLAKNRELEQQRQALAATIAASQRELDAIANPIRAKLLEARQQPGAKKQSLDLQPLAAWEFDGDLKDSLGKLDLQAHGKIEFQDGRVVLNKSHLQSSPLPIDLKAKTLEVWCQLPTLNQRGGGLMSIQGPGGVFDAIVLGERKPQQWISGSNNFLRTDDFADATAETVVDQTLHLAMVYAEDGTTTLFRNGAPYGKPFRKSSMTFPKTTSSVLFGLRHLPAGGNKFLSVRIEKARLYDRALTAEEIAASASGSNLFVSEKELLAQLSEPQQQQFKAAQQNLHQARAELEKVPPPQELKQLQQEAQRRFEDQLRAKLRSPVFQRVAMNDPRYGGVITNAAVLSMTSGPLRTQPIARGAWVIEAIFNDPPPPPPNNVPPLKEDGAANLTIREQFAAHRENPSCAGCHARIDPLGFALENFDITGRWRDKYENGKPVDASGTLLRKYNFAGAVDFKTALVNERQRFARAFVSHLLRFAVARELTPADAITIDAIISRSESDDFRLQSLIRAVVQCESFQPTK